MYCPNCSREAPADQKFCRACGMELQAVAELVSGQSHLTIREPAKQNAFQVQQRAMLVWGFVITFGAAAVGASIKLLGKEGIHPIGEYTPFVSVLALLAAFVGMGMMCYPFLQAMSPGARAKQRRSTKTQPTARLLNEEPSSITEHATELFEESTPRSEGCDAAPQVQR